MMICVAVAGGGVNGFLVSNFVVRNFYRNLDLLHLGVVINRMSSMSRLDNLSVESGVFVSSVVDSTGGAVRFNQLVVTFNLVAVTFLSLFLDVVSVFVLHPVLELIFGMGLKESNIS